jgi:hypothetical protein
MKVIEIQCSRCLIKPWCKSVGSSPSEGENGTLCCLMVGGYGVTPMIRSKLSPSHHDAYDSGSNCLTIVEIPKLDSGVVTYATTLILHPKISHEREYTDYNLSACDIKSFN